jgi:CheY-like chemotaxis protein
MILRHDLPSIGATVGDYSAEEISPQVLVVDDTKQIRDLLGAILRTCGCRVLEADDGLAAQDIVESAHPALVISDIEMPVSSGWDLLTYCHDHYPDMPVMLVSGNLQKMRPEIECWAAGIVAKPFDLIRLRTQIQRLVSRAA